MSDLWIGVIAVVAGLSLLWVILGIAYKKDVKDESLVKYVLLFDTKTKLFSEQRSDEFEEQEDEVMIAINNQSLLHSFNRFCTTELYHVSTVYQARRVFDIYLKSRENVNK